MTTFFFYGTLLDRDVMALVIGRRLPPSAFVPARLKGHARRRAKGVSYPILVRDPGGKVEGVVVGGLTRRDVERLSAYEGPRYRIAPLKVTVGGALKTVSVFEPKEQSFRPVAGVWDLALWQGRYKRPFVARIRKALQAHSVRL
jgi:Gamma-glutamyl cyclotransferase, AIG2-like